MLKMWVYRYAYENVIIYSTYILYFCNLYLFGRLPKRWTGDLVKATGNSDNSSVPLTEYHMSRGKAIVKTSKMCRVDKRYRNVT